MLKSAYLCCSEERPLNNVNLILEGINELLIMKKINPLGMEKYYQNRNGSEKCWVCHSNTHLFKDIQYLYPENDSKRDCHAVSVLPFTNLTGEPLSQHPFMPTAYYHCFLETIDEKIVKSAPRIALISVIDET